MHDRPWLLSDHVGPETTAAMAVVCNRVREVVGSNLPVGVQVLSAANRQALAIAKAAGKWKFHCCFWFNFSVYVK